MKRNIAFRAKRLSDGAWATGDFVSLYDDKGRRSHRIYTGYAESDCDELYPDWYEVDPDTVGQYTGMADVKGVKIFEGDIVRFNRIDALGWTRQRIGRILYAESVPVFYILATTGDGWDWCDCHDIELIGNVFDNPELLEGPEP